MTANDVQQKPKDAATGTAADTDAIPAEVTGGLSVDRFKEAFRSHPAGVAVICADDGSGPVGLTATSVFSVSAEPPLFSFSVSSKSSTADTIANAETIVAHLLGTHQKATALLFATKGANRFEDTSTWSRLKSGEPFLVDAPVWVRGRVVERLPMQVGASTVYVCHALEAHISPEYAPLIYHDRSWHQLSGQSKLPD